MSNHDYDSMLEHVASDVGAIPSIQSEVMQRLETMPAPRPFRFRMAMMIGVAAGIAITVRLLAPALEPSSTSFVDESRFASIQLDDTERLPMQRPQLKAPEWGRRAWHVPADLLEQKARDISRIPSNHHIKPQKARSPEAVNDLILTEHGLSGNKAGFTQFLNQFINDPGAIKKMELLVAQLGDKSFRVREKAMRALTELPWLPLDTLQKAAQSSDLELARRAKEILQQPKGRAQLKTIENRAIVLAAVLRTIRAKKLTGLTATLLKTIPWLPTPELLPDAVEAVAAGACHADAQLLRKSLASKNRTVQIAAIRGLGRVDRKSGPILHKLTKSHPPLVMLAASHALADLGDRKALTSLIALLSSKEESIRAEAVQVLRALARKSHGFNPFQSPSKQQPIIAQWQQWLRTNRQTTTRRLPLRLEPLLAELKEGLMVHHSFDKDLLDQINDNSGHKRQATVKQKHTTVPGVLNKALWLCGLGDMGNGGGHVDLAFIDFHQHAQFTIALWVKEEGMSNHHGEAYVVYGKDRGVMLEDSLGISHFNDEVIFRVGDGLLSIPFQKSNLNRWTHYAMTFDHGVLRAYQDGIPVGTKKAKVKIVGTSAALGRHWWHHGAGQSSRFIGAIDDFRVYNRALSPVQIRAMGDTLQYKPRIKNHRGIQWPD